MLLFVDLQREDNAITGFKDSQTNTVEASAAGLGMSSSAAVESGQLQLVSEQTQGLFNSPIHCKQHAVHRTAVVFFV